MQSGCVVGAVRPSFRVLGLLVATHLCCCCFFHCILWPTAAVCSHSKTDSCKEPGYSASSNNITNPSFFASDLWYDQFSVVHAGSSEYIADMDFC